MNKRSEKTKQRKEAHIKMREAAVDRIVEADAIEMSSVLRRHVEQRMLEQQAYSYNDK